jgi:putative thioredoxin
MLDFNRDVIAASHRQPVLVDFHAGWCPPCKMLGPVLDAMIAQAPGPLKLVKIDSDERADLAAAAGVSGIPDVRLYINGQQVGGFTGFRPLPAVKSFIAEHLARATQPADA